MRFEDTGLPNDKAVEAAFNYAFASFPAELEAQYKQRLELSYQDQLNYLDAMKDEGQLDDEMYKNYRDRLDKSLEDGQKRLPQMITQRLDAEFKVQRLSPVVEMQKYSEKSSPALVAAALLLDSVHDPLDFLKADAECGAAVSGVVAEVLHVRSHPGDHLATASVDAKHLIAAGLANTFGKIASQIMRLQENQQLRLPPKFLESNFAQIKLLWGDDKKMNTRLLETFNRVAEGAASPLRIELGTTGSPELVETVKKAPPAPKSTRPKLGDDGF